MAEYEDENEETPLIKQLRQQLEDQGKALKTGQAAERKLAFIEAGVDVSTKAGQLLFKSYDGDITDVDALKAEAEELGVYRGPATPPPPDEPPSTPGSVNLETGSQQRRQLEQGATAPDPNAKEDARVEAKRAYDAAIKAQASDEDAGAAWLRVIARRKAEAEGLT